MGGREGLAALPETSTVVVHQRTLAPKAVVERLGQGVAVERGFRSEESGFALMVLVGQVA